ncbi:reverse transcriptase domain-containing protein [Tanacetum coccineum]
MARKSMSQTKREEDKVAENASNKRKWEGNHNGSSSQQNKGHKVPRAHTTRPINKKAYVGYLPLTPTTARNQRTLTCYECQSLGHYKSNCPIVKFQNRVDMYWKGKARHYRNDYPERIEDQNTMKTKLEVWNHVGVVYALWEEDETKQDLNNIEEGSSLKAKVVSLD